MASQRAAAPDPLQSEARFVLATIGFGPDDDRAAHARKIASEGPDWAEIRRLANWHGVMPIVWRFVQTHRDDFPEAFSAALEVDYVGNALRSLKLARELIRIATGLGKIGIDVITLKGPALAIAAYGDLALRQFSDLDILIHERDLPRAARFLSESGYWPRRFDPESPDQSYFRDGEDEFLCVSASELLDVHWRLLPSYFPVAFDEDGLFDRAESVTIEDARLRTLAPIDTMIFLVAHATKHGWPVLRPICDIAALAARADFDWTSVMNEAARLRCRRMLMLAATLAADMAGAPIPEELRNAAQSDAHVVRLADHVKSRLFTRIGERPALFSEWIVPLGAIEGVLRRLKYCAMRGFRPTIEDRELIALARPLYPLYWAIRPLRLLVSHTPRLMPRAFRTRSAG